MGFFDQNKALIITVLLLSLLLLLMYNIKLSNDSAQMREMLVDLEHLQQEEPEEQDEAETEPEVEEPSTPQQPNLQTHQAYNQNQQQRQQDFDTRLNEIFERNAVEQTASEEENTPTSSGEYSVNRNTRDETRERSDGDNTSETTSAETGNTQNSSIAFSLVGRSASFIPNPIYTCDTSGKIVVNITVNERGAVTSTSINRGSSTSTNECLINNALEYAAGATFSKLDGRDNQKGTITYYFQG